MAYEDRGSENTVGVKDVPNKVYYPEENVTFTNMSPDDQLRHVCSVLGRSISDTDDPKKLVELLQTPEQRRIVVEMVRAFNNNCKHDNVPVLLSEDILNSVVFIPEKRIREVSESEDVFAKFIETDGVRVVAKVLESGLILISSEMDNDETRKRIAHELGHYYRNKGGFDSDSNNALEEGIVEDYAQKIVESMQISGYETYQFETAFVRAIYEKLNIPTGLALSMSQLSKLAENVYPGEEDGYPRFTFLVEDYLDFLSRLRRYSRLVEYYSDGQYQNDAKCEEYVRKIFDELEGYKDKWGLDINV